jgi:hypothetical protein
LLGDWILSVIRDLTLRSGRIANFLDCSKKPCHGHVWIGAAY